MTPYHLVRMVTMPKYPEEVASGDFNEWRGRFRPALPYDPADTDAASAFFASPAFKEWQEKAARPVPGAGGEVEIDAARALFREIPEHTEEFRRFRESLGRAIHVAENDVWRESDCVRFQETPDLIAVSEVAAELRAASTLLERVASVVELLARPGLTNILMAVEYASRFDGTDGVDIRIGEPDPEWQDLDLVPQSPRWVPWADIERFVKDARGRVMPVHQELLELVDIPIAGYEGSPRKEH